MKPVWRHNFYLLVLYTYHFLFKYYKSWISLRKFHYLFVLCNQFYCNVHLSSHREFNQNKLLINLHFRQETIIKHMVSANHKYMILRFLKCISQYIIITECNRESKSVWWNPHPKAVTVISEGGLLTTVFYKNQCNLASRERISPNYKGNYWRRQIMEE